MRMITVFADGKRMPRGRVIVDPDGVKTWETRVRESKHLYRALDAWTISETILGQLEDLHVGRIRFVVADRNNEIYEVSLDKFRSLAQELDQTGWRSATEPSSLSHAGVRKRVKLQAGSLPWRFSWVAGAGGFTPVSPPAPLLKLRYLKG